MSKKLLLVLLGLYAGSAVLTYSVFAMSSGAGFDASSLTRPAPSEEEVVEVAVVEDLILDLGDQPQDQPCPLTGQLYTQVEREAWEARRPLAVMVENSPDARPQSGLSRADITFEAVAEGGVTRFMPIFYCDAQRQDVVIAPVRSARTYFIDWASGFFFPLYAHVGGANTPGPADALGQINSYGWALENDINQFSVGYPTFVRNFNRIEGKDIATEHTMESTSEALWEVAAERGWTNINPEIGYGRNATPESDWADEYEGWQFREPGTAFESGSTTAISYQFWSGYDQYAVAWEYDQETNTYLRSMAGEPHYDMNNDEQVAVSNVIVLQTREQGPIDELKHMLYKTTGTGKALLFRDGEAEQINWSKPTRTSELAFTTIRGEDVELTPGKVWISVLDTAAEVTY